MTTDACMDGGAMSLSGGAVVLISGEAGIGKTRLIHEFFELSRLRRELIGQALVLDGGCGGHSDNIPHSALSVALRHFGKRHGWQTKQSRPEPKLDLLPDRLTSLERRAGVDRASSRLDAGWDPLAQRSGRINRMFFAALTATKAVSGSRRLDQIFRIMCRRTAQADGRSRSLVLGEPDVPDPPGQLVTAQPHVTRGPTSVRAVTVLSASGEPALR